MTSLSLMPKLAGHCSCCDEDLFEVLAFAASGPYQSEATEFGPMTKPAYRAEVVCISGRHMGFTLCENCKDEPDLKLMYEKMLLAHHRERKNWEHNGAKPFDERQMKIQTKESCKLVNDIPIGVLYMLDWKEIATHG